MNDFILIANPISGKGNAKNIAEEAYTALTESGAQGQLMFTSASGDAKRFAQEVTSDGIRSVIACGGDGTLHEVVNGIATTPDVILGVLPCGRGNDFAAAIGVPLKPEAAIATLLSGTPIRVDLGCCYQNSSQQSAVNPNDVARNEMESGSTERCFNVQTSLTEPQGKIKNYFTTIATCGYDTEVSRRAAKGTPLFAGTASTLTQRWRHFSITNRRSCVLKAISVSTRDRSSSPRQASQIDMAADSRLYRTLASTMGFSMFVLSVQCPL